MRRTPLVVSSHLQSGLGEVRGGRARAVGREEVRRLLREGMAGLRLWRGRKDAVGLGSHSALRVELLRLGVVLGEKSERVLRSGRS